MYMYEDSILDDTNIEVLNLSKQKDDLKNRSSFDR